MSLEQLDPGDPWGQETDLHCERLVQKRGIHRPQGFAQRQFEARARLVKCILQL
jgi:hypothetical protein